METKEIKLIKAYKKYINFLGDEYNKVLGIACIHNYTCKESDIKLGQQMRDTIKQLEEECGVPDDNVLMDYLY